MQFRQMGFRLTAVMVVLMFVATTGAAAQSADERRFAFRFGIVTGWPTVDPSNVDGDSLDLDLEEGPELSFEWYAVKKFGLEFDWSMVREAKVRVDDTVTGDTRLMNYTLNANWHIVRSESVDFALGLVGGMVRYDSTNFDTGTVVSSDTQVTWGLNTALDINVGSRWAVTIGARYLQSSLDLGTTVPECNCSEIEFNPIYLRVMGAYRF